MIIVNLLIIAIILLSILSTVLIILLFRCNKLKNASVEHAAAELEKAERTLRIAAANLSVGNFL